MIYVHPKRSLKWSKFTIHPLARSRTGAGKPDTPVLQMFYSATFVMVSSFVAKGFMADFIPNSAIFRAPGLSWAPR